MRLGVMFTYRKGVPLRDVAAMISPVYGRIGAPGRNLALKEGQAVGNNFPRTER